MSRNLEIDRILVYQNCDIMGQSSDNSYSSQIQQTILMRRNDRMAKTNDAVEIINRRYIKNDPTRQDLLREISLNAKVAQLIYTARKQAGLTQQQLADLIETKQSVIARLEDADYEGHSLSMLQRIGEALGQRIEINLVPTTKIQSSAV
jgi:ribosome-binding protein aMBF1 (putative translation factor)